MMLVGDIGGTHTRLALAHLGERGPMLAGIEVMPTSTAIADRLAHYLARTGATVDAVALCGAGPIARDGRLALTNHPCVLDAGDIAARLAIAPTRVRIVNDFEAVADAIPVLGDDDCTALTDAAGDPRSAQLVLGAGTGLGIATLLPANGDWRVLAGEGGHVDLAPVSEAECALHARLRRALGTFCAETILSGPGLSRLHAALHPHDPPMAPEQIAQEANAGDYEAQTTLGMFARWLGRVAANAALTVGARGGVRLAGGIVPGLGTAFDTAAFIEGFRDKPTQRAWLSAIPLAIVRHPQPGLLGLARRGLLAPR